MGWMATDFLGEKGHSKNHASPRVTMHTTGRSAQPTTIRTDLGAIFVSMELSRSTWLITLRVSAISGQQFR
jgi:hypothetical protein